MFDYIKIIKISRFTLALVIFIGCSTNSKIFLLESQATIMSNYPIQSIDLSPIKLLLSRANVVGLGEFVHASSKLHNLIAGISLSLIRDYNSRQILLEAPKYAVEQVNELIQPGNEQVVTIEKLDPLYKIWRTEGFANFLESIRLINQELDTPVQLIGFDVRMPKHAFKTFAIFFKIQW
ncbi:MAG: hypothetical protein H6625_03500 [Bdellovibrionaceae bacterium]|nr:hypothetical protein [Pseudobdellovibrionaceae bacterium]